MGLVVFRASPTSSARPDRATLTTQPSFSTSPACSKAYTRMLVAPFWDEFGMLLDGGSKLKAQGDHRN